MKQEKLIKSLTSIGFTENTAFAVASERIYQDSFWNEKTTESKGIHNEAEFLIFISDYLREAINIVSRGSEPTVSQEASGKLRCIIAMVVNCAEQNKWEQKHFDGLKKLYVKSDLKTAKINVGETLGLLQTLVNKGVELLPHLLLSREEAVLFNQLDNSKNNMLSSTDSVKRDLQQILTFISSYSLRSLEVNFNPMRESDRVDFGD